MQIENIEEMGRSELLIEADLFTNYLIFQLKEQRFVSFEAREPLECD